MIRIHSVGPSGSGTTTLAKALAHTLGIAHFDSDNYFWEFTDPPYTTKRSVPDRLSALNADLVRQENWILSGSLVGWGEPVAEQFTTVIFLLIPPEVRLARIKDRERSKFGSRIEVGGDMHANHLAFMEWAAGYDNPAFAGRSKHMHEEWLKRFKCPVIRLEGDMTTAAQVAKVRESLV